MKQRIWLSWETQRRSIELSRVLGCTLFLFDIPGIMRYPLSIIKTIFTLLKHQKSIVFVQNPSMFLAAIACFFGPLTRSVIIIDRHTTFRLNKPQSGSFSIWLFMRLHYYTLAKANLTIVTNQFLADLVKKANGNPFVLPDRLPDVIPKYLTPLSSKVNILFITSFGNDEPIQEVLTAAECFTTIANFYVTGNYKKRWPSIPIIPENVSLTGFISEDNFVSYLFSCDIVLVLTKSDYCMLCGCYEAIAAVKPLITSDKRVLKEYFSEAVFVDNTPAQIVDAINVVFNNIAESKNKTLQMKERISYNWNVQFANLEKTIGELSVNKIQPMRRHSGKPDL